MVGRAARRVPRPPLARSTHQGREGRIAIATPEVPLVGDDLLSAVTEAMVALHERHHHRVPVSARTALLEGELLACVMGGVYTDVEKTMIELQRSSDVREVRSAFQQAMQHRFVDVVQRLSGRRVLTFISTHSVGPDIEVQLFVLGPALGEDVPDPQGPGR